MTSAPRGKTLLNPVHDLPIAEADVRVFIGVADTGSFTAAASLHELTPSAASKAVTRLETALGVRLLARTTRAVRLTEEGLAFHERCTRAFELLAQAAEEASAAAAEISGTVRIGLPSLFGTYFIAPRLPALLAAHPRLRIELVSTMRLADIAERALDFAIVVGPLADSSLVAQPLGYGQFVTVASPGHLTQAGTPATPGDLRRHRCLAWTRPDQREDPWSFVVDGRPASIDPQAVVRSDDMHHLAAMAVAGVGITHLPMFVVADAIAAGKLVTVLEGAAPPPKLASFVYPATRSLPRRVRRVIEHLGDARGAMPGTRRKGAS